MNHHQDGTNFEGKLKKGLFNNPRVQHEVVVG
jgi:hypothetical protein